MAENFVLPKAFTKEWFSYVWDYYKYHILIGIAVIVLAIFTIVEITTAIKYDANINFVSTSVITQENADKITDACEIAGIDIDENDEVNISFSQLNFTEQNLRDPSLYWTMMNKLMATFATEEEYIYIMDEKMMNDIISMESTEGLFVPVDVWATTNDTENEYGASLKNSTILQENGIDSSDMFIMIRECYNDNDKELKIKQENAIVIAKFLVK
jgi:hypothetical protein